MQRCLRCEARAQPRARRQPAQPREPRPLPPTPGRPSGPRAHPGRPDRRGPRRRARQERLRRTSSQLKPQHAPAGGHRLKTCMSVGAGDPQSFPREDEIDRGVRHHAQDRHAVRNHVGPDRGHKGAQRSLLWPVPTQRGRRRERLAATTIVRHALNATEHRPPRELPTEIRFPHGGMLRRLDRHWVDRRPGGCLSRLRRVHQAAWDLPRSGG